MKINQIKIGAILSYLSMGLTILISLFYGPIMRSALGQSEYGLYNVTSSVISSLGILTLGMGGSYIRYFSIYKSKNDDDKISSLNGLFFIFYAVIAFITLIISLILSRFTVQIFGPELTSEEHQKARIILIILSINAFLSLIVTPFTSYINANERFVWQKSLGIIRILVSPLVTYPVILFTNLGSIGVAIATTCLGIAIDIVNIIYAIKKAKIKIKFKKIEGFLLKEILVFSFWLFLEQIIGQINWNVDNYLVSYFYGTSLVAVYSIGESIDTYFREFSTSIVGVTTPRIHLITEKYKEDKSNVEVTKLMTKIGRIQFIILMPILFGFIFFGVPFMRWWGANYTNIDESYYIAIIFMLFALFEYILSAGNPVLRAKNKQKFRILLKLGMAIINIFLTIWLLKYLKIGPVGGAIGTGITLFATNLIMIFYYNRSIKIDMKYLLKNIIRFIPSLIIPIIFGVFYVHFINIEKVSYFLLGLGIFVIIYLISVWFLALNEDEKRTISNPFKRIFGKIQ